MSRDAWIGHLFEVFLYHGLCLFSAPELFPVQPKCGKPWGKREPWTELILTNAKRLQWIKKKKKKHIFCCCVTVLRLKLGLTLTMNSRVSACLNILAAITTQFLPANPKKENRERNSDSEVLIYACFKMLCIFLNTRGYMPGAYRHIKHRTKSCLTVL